MILASNVQDQQSLKSDLKWTQCRRAISASENCEDHGLALLRLLTILSMST